MKNSTQLESKLSLEDIIGTSLKIPGVKVSRNDFLRSQFNASDIDIDELLAVGPVEYGISREQLSILVNKLIVKRTSQSSAASFIAGIPGGIAMAATIPADMLQFFGMALRLAQEISYLYGSQDLWSNGEIDDEKVKSQLIIYCGVMFGVSGAVSGMRIVTAQLAKTALNKIPQKALMKQFWYRMLKQIGKILSFKVTKDTFAKGVSKAIPVIGGVISGSLNFASMMPMAKRLYKAFDKSIFDYSDEEFESDLNTVEKMANGEVVVDSENNSKSEIKEKISGGLKSASAGISDFVGKFKKKTESKSESENDSFEQIKKFKELLDMGVITQDEFDKKKSELLGL